jgi:hypothetical protein
MKRNVARVMPVGDVDVVVLQQRLHGAAQQGGEMPGHRRHQQRHVAQGYDNNGLKDRPIRTQTRSRRWRNMNFDQPVAASSVHSRKER